MTRAAVISSPDDAALDALCRRLAERADALDAGGDWPAEQLAWCAESGVFQWFVPREYGGQQWSGVDVVRGYLRLSEACLTTTFILTQWNAACGRIAACDNRTLKAALLPDLNAGRTFATVGISHLTTSRRHLGQPALAARETEGGYLLDGYSAWVTGGVHADTIVLGAALADGRQLLAAVPRQSPGLSPQPPARLTALTASHTGQVHCVELFLPSERLLAGPAEDVMSGATGAASGGLQTSTLALGLATAAIRYLRGQAERRTELHDPAAALAAEQAALQTVLLCAAAGEPAPPTNEIRARANSLALRAAQAALSAAKGAGFVVGHPAGRWCREALFFLVWSCPQPVANANLCELAGIRE